MLIRSEKIYNRNNIYTSFPIFVVVLTTITISSCITFSILISVILLLFELIYITKLEILIYLVFIATFNANIVFCDYVC